VAQNDQAGRRVVELAGPECWKLLASVPVGRVVFSHQAMPAVRVVSHLVDNRTIIVRSPQGAVITGHTVLADQVGITGHGGTDTDVGTVVCYEADEMNPACRTGWSVMVTGVARVVRDPAAIARYARLLDPWTQADTDQVIAIEPGVVTGRRLIP
jgi:hypothetical protein